MFLDVLDVHGVVPGKEMGVLSSFSKQISL